MVHIRDEGSYVEGSIQTVWRYLNSGEPHAQAHRTVRNRQVKPVGDNTMIATMERNWRGTWVRVVNRLTVLPPLGTLVEVLEGPFAGSKSFTVYTPEGNRTRIDVYGEFESPTLPPAEVEKAALEWMEESFNEDAPAIKALQSSS
jgi:hypothetical protein